MLTKIREYFNKWADNYEQEKTQRLNKALKMLPDLKPEQRFCGKCGELMQGTFTDAYFFQFHGKSGLPIYYMDIDYICPNSHKTRYRQGVNNYEGY